MSENAINDKEINNKENNLESPLIENKEENSNNLINNDNLQNKNEEQNENKKEKNNEDRKIDKNEVKNEDMIEDKSNEGKKNLISTKTIESMRNLSYIIKRKIRWIIFLIFLIINLLMNVYHGVVPAATEQLKEYLNLSDSELGLFGSLVFVGVIIGSLVSLTIINTFNRKYILIICLILCGLSLFIFTMTKRYILLCIDRVIIGIFQAFISIYLPIWCDQFGIEKRKTMMIALIQVAPPLGVLVGYLVTTLLNMYLKWFPYFGDIDENERWLYSFYLQSFLIWGLSICLFMFPDKYFNARARRVPLEIEETLNKIESQNSGNEKKLSFFYEENQKILDELKEDNNSPNISEGDEKEEDNIDGNEDENKDDNLINDNNAINNIDEIGDNEKNKKSDNNKKEKLETKKSNEKNNSSEDISFFTKLKLIFSEPLFICCVLTISILFFTLTCVQYWSSDYMLDALGVEDEKKRLYCFSFVCLTSPTLGLIIGGYIIDKIGGYSKKGALVFSLVVSLCSMIPTIPIPLVNGLYLYAFFLWLLLFFGGALLPPLQGIIIACLPRNVQGSGNSFVIFFYNLLGYLPAPYVYGTLKENKGSRVAQKVTTYMTFLASICIGIATFIRFHKDEEYNKKMGRASSKLLEEIQTKENKEKDNSLSIKVKDEVKFGNKLFENENEDEDDNKIIKEETKVEDKNEKKENIVEKNENKLEDKLCENNDEIHPDEQTKVCNDKLDV